MLHAYIELHWIGVPIGRVVHCPSIQHDDSPFWNKLALVDEVVAGNVWRAEPEGVVAALYLSTRSVHFVISGLGLDALYFFDDSMTVRKVSFVFNSGKAVSTNYSI